MQYANKHLNGDVWCVSLVVQSKSHITYTCGAQLSLSVWSQRMRDEVRYTHLRLPKLETPYINSIQFNCRQNCVNDILGKMGVKRPQNDLKMTINHSKMVQTG